jgi:hypothetical protein
MEMPIRAGDGFGLRSAACKPHSGVGKGRTRGVAQNSLPGGLRCLLRPSRSSQQKQRRQRPNLEAVLLPNIFHDFASTAVPALNFQVNAPFDMSDERRAWSHKIMETALSALLWIIALLLCGLL